MYGGWGGGRVDGHSLRVRALATRSTARPGRRDDLPDYGKSMRMLLKVLRRHELPRAATAKEAVRMNTN